VIPEIKVIFFFKKKIFCVLGWLLMLLFLEPKIKNKTKEQKFEQMKSFSTKKIHFIN
jgi:hypothetical protein